MPIKIIIDTNLWVSFVLKNLQSPLRTLLDDEDIEIITSDALTKELFGVLYRSKFKNKISPETITIFEEYYNLFTLDVKIISVVTVCRDPKDNYLLALAQDAEADYLLTGDADLLELNQFGKTNIMKITEFLDNFH